MPFVPYAKRYGYQRRYAPNSFAKRRFQQYKKLRGAPTMGNYPTQELRAYDASVSDQTVWTANVGKFYLLNAMSASAAEGGRTGNSVYSTSIRINGHINMHTSSLLISGNRVRATLFWDSQPNGVEVTNAQLWGASPSTYALPNLAYQQRFKILRDQVLNANDYFQYTAGSEKADIPISFFVKLPKVQTGYLGGGTGIASVATNALYLCVMSELGQTVDLTACEFVSRLRYLE